MSLESLAQAVPNAVLLTGHFVGYNKEIFCMNNFNKFEFNKVSFSFISRNSLAIKTWTAFFVVTILYFSHYKSVMYNTLTSVTYAST